MSEFSEYLSPTAFIDFEQKDVLLFTEKHSEHCLTNKEKIVSLYFAVRDQILYDPYKIIMNPEAISASQTLQRGYGYCIEKSILLAACGRAIGVPSRLGFSIVKNHLAHEKFIELLRTDKFVFHGYNEFWLGTKWVKCTPAFNKALCEKFKTQPLDFDGENDSIFQPYSADGKQYMEYLHEYGQFADFPYALFYDELKKHYPHLFEKKREHIIHVDS